MNRQKVIRDVIDKFVRLFDKTPYAEIHDVQTTLESAKNFLAGVEFANPDELILEILRYLQCNPPIINSQEVELAVRFELDQGYSVPLQFLLERATFLNKCTALQ